MSEERQAAGRTCPKCGERILSKHKVFCPNCGVNMPQYAASPRPAPRTPIYTDEQGNRLKKCPFCAEEIKAEAIVCKHCGRDLNAKESQFNATPGGALLMAIAGFLFLLGLGAPRVWGETLPWAGFCIAEILALVILAAAVAQGKF